MSRRAHVLGAGVAGLHAALLLADRGFAVQLHESRARLGGRAFTLPRERGGMECDNGPHVILGCYRDFRQLLRRIGAEHCFAFAPALRVAYRRTDGRASALELSRLPIPLAMPLALAHTGMTLGARLRALRGMVGVLLGCARHLTLQQWLDRSGQHGDPAALLWVPLCRALMNAEPAEVQARIFLRTLREAFRFGAAGGAIALPRTTWGEILDGPAVAALARAGVALHTGSRVTGLEVRDGSVCSIHFGDSSSTAVDRTDLVVSAVPWHALAAFDGLAPGGAKSLASSPIVSVWFRMRSAVEAPVPDEPLVAFVDGDPFHFLVRRPGGDPRDFAVLAGGCRALDGVSVAEIRAAAERQLVRHLPGFDPEAVAEAHVTKEAHATFLASVGSDSLRPRPGPLASGPANLVVCGDWTDCGLPATLEGAARSARIALAAIGLR